MYGQPGMPQGMTPGYPMGMSHQHQMMVPATPTPPPADVNVRLRIDKMAEYIVRNGGQFEEMMRQKQQGNHDFDFLFGGENSAYYQWSRYAMMNGYSEEAAAQYVREHIQQQVLRRLKQVQDFLKQFSPQVSHPFRYYLFCP